jgi:hypothetical protein
MRRLFVAVVLAGAALAVSAATAFADIAGSW